MCCCCPCNAPAGDYDAYCKAMSKPGEWGDHITLQVGGFSPAAGLAGRPPHQDWRAAAAAPLEQHAQGSSGAARPSGSSAACWPAAVPCSSSGPGDASYPQGNYTCSFLRPKPPLPISVPSGASPPLSPVYPPPMAGGRRLLWPPRLRAHVLRGGLLSGDSAPGDAQRAHALPLLLGRGGEGGGGSGSGAGPGPSLAPWRPADQIVRTGRAVGQGEAVRGRAVLPGGGQQPWLLWRMALCCCPARWPACEGATTRMALWRAKEWGARSESLSRALPQVHYNSVYPADEPPAPLPSEKLFGSRRLYNLVFGDSAPLPH